jgi:anthraniloyl-CoA monooxygenase
VVLVGDAAHTAHPSVGSGTKLALEDAIALADCLSGESKLDRAFTEYESRRRPGAARLQQLARRSQLWWESFPHRASKPVSRVAVSYMTRGGNISLESFIGTQADTVNRALTDFAGHEPPSSTSQPFDVESWILNRPISTAWAELPSRLVGEPIWASWAVVDDPTVETVSSARRANEAPLVARMSWPREEAWGSMADELVAACRQFIAEGADAVWLSGPDDRESVLSRMDVAERLRLQVGSIVGVDLPQSCRSDAATSIVAERCDLVRFTPIDRH